MTSTIKLNADNYPIKSVTVFKSNKAEVVRVFDVSLQVSDPLTLDAERQTLSLVNYPQPGQSKIQISHLPGSIDTDSARVTGLGDAQLSDVVCSVGRGIEEIDPQSTSEVIRKLRVKKDALVKDRGALDDISDTMANYSRTLVGDTVSPNRAETFFENLLTRSQTLRSTRAGLEEEILQITRQINVLSSAEERKQGESDGEVTVVVLAKQATEIELKLTYRTRFSTSVIGIPDQLHFQLSRTRHGLRRTSYTQLRMLAFHHRRCLYTTVRVSRKARAKTGQVSLLH